ncbi:2-C-methyl-D-erythritol 2,4-cyclodiphosphate synthase [Desulfurella sp.]|uniref:2-C-methyl-D-erythritol 2,4-cyclodiphosphate synthase n=1 Tax=Desulfurella sp. TaxID=1962857 RepID=UPI0025B7D9EF|nr:2-C-methyl-D-erythritol 2,4-cyclodiphosphate synthase [Desulfurella sp.]
MIRVGIGYDLHRLKKDCKLIIGGIEIDSNIGAYSHSDGDCLLHALVDAMLGAAGLGDIGEHFPDIDEKYKNIKSSFFVTKTLELINKNGFRVINVDATVLLEKPKLIDYKQTIKINIANLLNISEHFVNIKAKTNEKIGEIGESLAIASYVVVLLEG